METRQRTRWIDLRSLGAMCVFAATAFVYAQQSGFFQSATYTDPDGAIQTVTTGPAIDTSSHPFWQPIGANGRACVTCHNPANAMGLSLQTINDKFNSTEGSDPLFAMIDGGDCPTKTRSDPASHALLLKHGAFRIARPWPPKDVNGNVITPDFQIEVVNDPTQCNTDSTWGINGSRHEISVFRRPRMAANLGFILAPDPSGWSVKKGIPLDRDPATGTPLSGNLMADGRLPTLGAQANDAFINHLQGTTLSASQLETIVNFESTVFTAQVKTLQGSSISGGVATLEDSTKSPRNVLGVTAVNPIFPDFENLATRSKSGESADQTTYLDSVARGYNIYKNKTFIIKDVANLNSIGIGNPVKNSCNTCHNHQNMGNDLAPGFMDIGVENMPNATLQPDYRDYPLFKITCNADAPPHPFLGRVIYTTDPGTALVTGKCVDVGSVNFQQLRGLAARAPYFTNGSATDLRAVVNYYDQRFNIGYTEQEIEDLVNFMKAL
jgi:hypothetical protein